MRARAQRAGALLLAVCAVGCFGGGSPVTDGDALEAMVVRVESVRGIRAERPIAARVVGQAELADLLAAAVVAHRTPDEVARYEAGLVTVGLWPSDRRLLDEVVAVLGEEVAGLYLSDERALLVVGDSDVPFPVWLSSVLARRDFMAEFALSHELVHLLQHQRHPELLESDAIYFRHDDLALAVQTAFEGDALYFGVLSLGGPLPSPDVFESSFDGPLGDPDSAFAAAPRLLQELLAFPYAQGYRLALAETSRLLEDPPASSEQVIHPEQRRADFTAFDLSPVAAGLPDGCSAVFENTVGELQLRILLQEVAPLEVDPDVWQGWDGDRYLAARCGDRRALLWLTAWDDERDAEEFAAAYAALADRLAARAGLTGPLHVERSGRDVVVASAELAGLVGEAPERATRRRLRTVAELRAFAAD